MSKNLFLIATGVPPRRDSGIIKAAKELIAHGWTLHLFSPETPSPEMKIQMYEHLEMFAKEYTNLKKALVEKKYMAVFLFSRNVLDFYYPLMKKITKAKIILLDELGKGAGDRVLVAKNVGQAEKLLNVKPEKKRSKLVSIVMLTFNQLALTKQCLKSMEKNTNYPYELIIVDNGSADGTVEYLKQYQTENLHKVQCIFNDKNLAFSKANNQGIKRVTGNYVLLLNNDVVLTGGWLTGLVDCIESDRMAGAAGPYTNQASGPQRINRGYSDLSELPGFAEGIKLKNAGKRIECHRLTAFCLLIKREVIEKIGVLDEQFGPGGFEDYDYCLRIRQNGYKILLAADTYVHHVGGQGYEPNRLDYNKLRQVNKNIFIEKWSRRALEIIETLPDG